MSKPTLKARRDDNGHVDIYSKNGEKSQDEKMLQPYRHIAQNLRMQNIRMITNAYNYWFNVPKEKLAAIEEIFSIIYNACFLVDDIEDRSTVRRGGSVAHSIYGAASTLVAANYATNIALEKILDFIEVEGNIENIAETTRAVAELFVKGSKGQGLEIYWKESFTCPTEEEYFQMCGLKNVAVFHLATTLMCVCSKREENFSKFNIIFAETLQVANDYENFTSNDSFERKTFCDDITEGKFTLPIIYAIRSHPEDHQIIDILRLGTTDYKLKRHCLSLMQKFGSLEYTRKRIAHLREEAKKEAKRFGNNPSMDVLIAFAFGGKE